MDDHETPRHPCELIQVAVPNYRRRNLPNDSSRKDALVLRERTSLALKLTAKLPHRWTVVRTRVIPRDRGFEHKHASSGDGKHPLSRGNWISSFKFKYRGWGATGVLASPTVLKEQLMSSQTFVLSSLSCADMQHPNAYHDANTCSTHVPHVLSRIISEKIGCCVLLIHLNASKCVPQDTSHGMKE